ncbi:hypothetical protein ACFLY6_02450 [Candidatus Dependentiae bacterium]
MQKIALIICVSLFTSNQIMTDQSKIIEKKEVENSTKTEKTEKKEEKTERWQPGEFRNVSGSMNLLLKIYLKRRLAQRETLEGIINAKNATLDTIRDIEDGFLKSKSGDKETDTELVEEERADLLEQAGDFIATVHEFKRYLKPIITASLKNREGIDFNSSPVVGFVGQADALKGLEYLRKKVVTEETLKQVCIELYTIIDDLVSTFPNAKKSMKKVEEEMEQEEEEYDDDENEEYDESRNEDEVTPDDREK